MVYKERRFRRVDKKRYVGMNITLIAVGIFSLIITLIQLPDFNSRLILLTGVGWLIGGLMIHDD